MDPKKKNILLLNKADLLSKEQRQKWVDYFILNNIQFRFFSAYIERKLLEEKEKAKKMNILNNIEEEDKEDDSVLEPFDEDDLTSIMNSQQLVDYLEKLTDAMLPQGPERARRATVGMVGYPNVGKSSTINVLCQAKKVAESATPGKTKHFQTILLNEKICLCDCPGLVFPSFIATKSDMVCNGLLPIDQMRDHVGPVALVCQRIPRFVLEQMYGIVLPAIGDFEEGNKIPSPHDLMQSYGKARGFMGSHGRPDEPRSSRYILKDYVNGKLLHCHPPPGTTPAEFNAENYKDFKVSEASRYDSVTDSLAEMQAQPVKQQQLYQGKRKVRVCVPPLFLFNSVHSFLFLDLTENS